MKSKFAILVLSFVVTACGKSGPERNEPAHTLKGSLTSNLALIQKGEWASECDQQNPNLRREITRSLDDRRSQIEQALKSKSQDSGYLNKISVGPLSLYDVNAPAVPDLWEVESSNWAQAEQFFITLDSNSPIEKWAKLNSLVRSLIMLDKERSVGGWAYAFGRSDEAMLTQAANIATACENDSSCTSINIDFTARQTLDREPFYKYHFYQIQNNSSTASKRISITKVADGLRQDVARIVGWKSRAVDRLDSQTFGVRLYGDVFGSAKSVVSSILESAWQINGTRIQVQWQDSFAQNVVRFLIDLPIGERAYFDKRVGEVHLAALSRKKTLVHEFGHVLGLPDQYFEVWEPSTCSYRVEFNSANLMSDSFSGNILPEHFSRLQKLY